MNQKTRMALGLCKYCETPRAPDKIVCDKHAEEKLRGVLEKQHARRAVGKCRYCDLPPVEGMTICQSHRDAKAAQHQARVEGRQVRGLCRLCDSVPALGKKLCQFHLDQAREQERLARPRLRESRKKAGSCVDCDAPPLLGKSQCQKHYEKMLEHSQRLETRASRRAYKRGKGRYASARANAIRKGLVWALTSEQFYAKVSSPCEYCGLMFEGTGVGNDRLDNGFGYTDENTVPCCTECNVARGDRFTPDEMRSYIGPAIRAVKLARRADDQAEYWTSAERSLLANRRAWGLE